MTLQDTEPSFIVCFILTLWFNSSAFVEYLNFFNLGYHFYTHDFEEKQKKNLELNYISYLKIYHDSFYIRLITCPICLSVWLNLLACLIFYNFSNFFISAWLSLFLFYLLSVLIKKYDE